MLLASVWQKHDLLSHRRPLAASPKTYAEPQGMATRFAVLRRDDRTDIPFVAARLVIILRRSP